MKSERLVVTRLGGPEDLNGTEMPDPGWNDIEDAIKRLNGSDCTLVTLGIGPPPVPHMAIGGGENGKYIVYATVDNAVFYKLINTKALEGKCMLVAGGQQGKYDLKICVSLGDALCAAKTYALFGINDSTLIWERQG
jgi:hypothetical protein